MSSSVLSIAVSQLAFATVGAGALAALALCMRATVRRDAVVRYRVMAAFVIAMLLMIPAQLAASRWAPPWSGWLGERDSATWRIITHWHGIVGGIERPAEPVPFESQAQGTGPHAVAAPVASSGWPAVTVRALVVLVYVAGCGVMLLLGACRVVRVAKLLRNCRPVTSSSVLALWNDICASRHFFAPCSIVALRSSRHSCMPRRPAAGDHHSDTLQQSEQSSLCAAARA